MTPHPLPLPASGEREGPAQRESPPGTRSGGDRSRGSRRRPNWFGSLAVYRRPRLVAVLLMGFSSGLPLALTYATLSFRLAEIGVSRTAIGLFALVGIPYSVKFLWSPLIDRAPIPWFTR